WPNEPIRSYGPYARQSSQPRSPEDAVQHRFRLVRAGVTGHDPVQFAGPHQLAVEAVTDLPRHLLEVTVHGGHVDRRHVKRQPEGASNAADELGIFLRCGPPDSVLDMNHAQMKI